MRNLNTEEVLLVAGGEDVPASGTTTECQWEQVHVQTETTLVYGTNATGSYNEVKTIIKTDGTACQHYDGAADLASATMEVAANVYGVADTMLDAFWIMLIDGIEMTVDAFDSATDAMADAWEAYQQQCLEATEAGYGAYVCCAY